MSGDVRYAGFWLRCWAFLLDSVCLMALLVPTVLAIYGASYFSPSGGWFRGPADILLQLVVPFVLIFWFWKKWLATPGKMLLGSKIVDARTGGDPSGGQLLIRYLGYFVSMAPLGLGFLWVAFDGRKQGWHDKLAGTVVVLTDPVRRTRRLLLAFTAFSVAATILVIAAGGVWLWQNQRLLSLSWERAELAQQEGVSWGLGSPAQRCVSHALGQLDSCDGFFCGYRGSLFLSGCLSVSQELDAFCQDVPTGLGSLLSVSWQSERCRAAGREGLACLQVMSVPIGICRQLGQRPPAEEVGPAGFVK